MTRSNFILSILELLEELKTNSETEHNIKITSAIISRPSWVSDWIELSDLFDEACLLADVEVLEQPYSRVHISTKTATHANSVLVVDHSYYNLGIHLYTRDEEWEGFVGKVSTKEKHSGLMHMLYPLSITILKIWDSVNNTFAVEAGATDWVKDIGTTQILNAVNAERLQLRHGTGLAQDVEFANRTTAVNMTDSTGYSRSLNMTGQNILDAEKRYFDGVGMLIKLRLLNTGAALAYYAKGLFVSTFSNTS